MRRCTPVFAALLFCCALTMPAAAQLEITTKLRQTLFRPVTNVFDETRNTFQGQADLFPDYDVTAPDALGGLSGLEGEVGLFSNVPRFGKFGLTFGYGCFKYKRYTSAWVYRPAPLWTSTDKLRLGLVTMPLTIQHEWPCRFVDNLNWHAGIGVDFLKSDFYYNFMQTTPDDTSFQRGYLSDTGLGWHGEFGAEFEVVPRVRLTFDIKYRSATLDNYRGILRNELGEHNSALLTREMVESGYIFGSRYETDPGFDDAEPAKMDFSGFQIGFGIKYNLFKTKLTF